MLVENLEEGVGLLNQEGEINFANPRLVKWLGGSTQEILGKSIINFLDPIPYDKAINLTQSERIFESMEFKSEVTAIETALRFKDHPIIPVKVTISPIVTRDQFKGNLVLLTDLSEQKRLQNLQDQFIATTSHELRTPLTVIRGYMDYLQYNKDLNEETRQEIYAKILSNIARLGRFTENVHDLSKIQHAPDLFDINPSLVNVIEFTKTMEEQVRLLYPRSPIVVNYQILGSDTNPEHMMDTDRVLQAVLNLVSNSLKNSPEQSIIEISVIKDKDNLRISVFDRGTGIPMNRILHLFRPFAHYKTKYSARGAGLGLFIVKTIALAHKGRIEVISQENEGSIFTLVISDLGN
jgi:PAS domain S-box-containing protein